MSRNLLKDTVPGGGGGLEMVWREPTARVRDGLVTELLVIMDIEQQLKEVSAKLGDKAIEYDLSRFGCAWFRSCSK